MMEHLFTFIGRFSLCSPVHCQKSTEGVYTCTGGGKASFYAFQSALVVCNLDASIFGTKGLL